MYFIPNTLVGKVDNTKNREDVLVWIKLRKEYLRLSRNVILGCVYAVAENSTHVQQDVFNILENEIACIAADHEILICSDYNGRTGRFPDFATYCTSGNDENLPYRLPDDNLTSDPEIRCMFEQGMLTRISEDSHVNNHGKRLIN